MRHPKSKLAGPVHMHMYGQGHELDRDTLNGKVKCSNGQQFAGGNLGGLLREFSSVPLAGVLYQRNHGASACTTFTGT